VKLLLDKVSTKVLQPDEITLLESAYSHLHQLHDPLRCNIFALLLRELIRIVMSRLAPDDQIEKAKWFKPGDDYDKVTRKDRYRFAISGHLPDETIRLHPELDTKDICNDLNKQISKLSKYTHISPGTTNLSLADGIEFSQEIEEVVLEYLNTLILTQNKIESKILEFTETELNTRLQEDLPSDLDALSSQTIFERAYVEDIKELDLSSVPLTISGRGTIEVELNYGRGDDGATFGDSYPFTYVATIDSDTLQVQEISTNIDTSSFYGEDEHA
jgi:hypothetical protein